MNPRLNQHPVVRDFFWLTRYTNPYGTEVKRFGTRLKRLGARKDDHGNFILDIGEARTVFAAHLDTADKELTRVRRKVDGDIIHTDGNTILGADDRAGVAVLLHLIRNQVPGRYVFFVGEEVGRIGSEASAKFDADDWLGFDRMICWDRYGTSSIITYQMGTQTASDTFAETLAAMYGAVSDNQPDHLSPIVLTPDNGGTYTDSFSFIDLIPECTNISIGYLNQHTKYEKQDARFLVSMAEASVQIAWEELPTEIDKYKRDEQGRAMGLGGWSKYYDNDDASWYTIPPAETGDDLVEQAMHGTLVRSDVREFVYSHPEATAELLYILLNGDWPW